MEVSCIVNSYKGKGDALECGNYRDWKLLEHVMKVVERIVEASETIAIVLGQKEEVAPCIY